MDCLRIPGFEINIYTIKYHRDQISQCSRKAASLFPGALWFERCNKTHLKKKRKTRAYRFKCITNYGYFKPTSPFVTEDTLDGGTSLKIQVVLCLTNISLKQELSYISEVSKFVIPVQKLVEKANAIMDCSMMGCSQDFFGGEHISNIFNNNIFDFGGRSFPIPPAEKRRKRNNS